MAEGTIDIVITGQSVPATFGLAPIGWHVPAYAEWEALLAELGGWAIAGIKLKEIGFVHWDTTNINATNSSGFTSLGSGWRTKLGIYWGLLSVTRFWSADEFDATRAYAKELTPGSDSVGWADANKKEGHSIRLIKDDSTDPGTMTDYDGNIYPTVKIGTQVWMASNLKVTHYNDGTPIPNVIPDADWAALTTGAMYDYNTP
jgi:uncharacterized protein (TIGR02145 family)